MKQITYSLADLCNRIEEVHGKITTPFNLRYPTDFRCRYTLRIHVGCEGWDMCWYEADDGGNVFELIGMDVVSFQWTEHDDNKILAVVVMEDESNE